MRERKERREWRLAARAHNLLELGRRFLTLAGFQIRKPAHILRPELSGGFAAARGLQLLKRLRSVAMPERQRRADRGQPDAINDSEFWIFLRQFLDERLRLAVIATQRQREAA